MPTIPDTDGVPDMIDTAKLTAAVETLQDYCEQVRLVMVAKGYEAGFANIDIGINGRGGLTAWVFERPAGPAKSFDGRKGDLFVAALAYAESLPPAVTPDDFAATIGITPDGRVLEMEG